MRRARRAAVMARDGGGSADSGGGTRPLTAATSGRKGYGVGWGGASANYRSPSYAMVIWDDGELDGAGGWECRNGRSGADVTGPGCDSARALLGSGEPDRARCLPPSPAVSLCPCLAVSPPPRE